MIFKLVLFKESALWDSEMSIVVKTLACMECDKKGSKRQSEEVVKNHDSLYKMKFQHRHCCLVWPPALPT